MDELRQFSTCILSDALEKFDIRLKNFGYTRSGLRSVAGDFSTVVGYAATACVRSSDPPVLGTSFMFDRSWWHEIAAMPKPVIVTIEDVDPHPGYGSCCGQSSAALFAALGCAAVTTNGAVRDLEEIAAIGLPVLASHVAPSHSYAHVVHHSQRVSICGLVVSPFDLLAVDRHGILSIPAEVAAELPRVASEVKTKKSRFIDLCRTKDLSLDQLLEHANNLRP